LRISLVRSAAERLSARILPSPRWRHIPRGLRAHSLPVKSTLISARRGQYVAPDVADARVAPAEACGFKLTRAKVLADSK
jgi:hypothetical protein